jgi:predicted Zn-dependent protease
MSNRRKSKIKVLEIRQLEAAEGWIGLGDYEEAERELKNLPPALRSHPDVLEMRWRICAHRKKWNACLRIATALARMTPNSAGGWIRRADSLGRMKSGGPQKARDALLPLLARFPDEPMVPYTLARHIARMGQIQKSREWLRKAFQLGNPAKLKPMAFADPDLERVWGASYWGRQLSVHRLRHAAV